MKSARSAIKDPLLALRAGIVDQCRRQDLNLHCLAATRPSTWRVCQFRHSGAAALLWMVRAAVQECFLGGTRLRCRSCRSFCNESTHVPAMNNVDGSILALQIATPPTAMQRMNS